ncbi:MAG: hypothetical protein A2V86_15455 [Deltaproteobacteria bacterium RBG_16_49_23]|nr:MAG: hypothetical protein A2V86_15455 [Deltaproteobacteria bacterium RBG_16_49_23]
MKGLFINNLKIEKTSIYKIPPDLPFSKGGIAPLWPPAHRASGPEGKEGQEEIFQCLCQFNCKTVNNPGKMTG